MEPIRATITPSGEAAVRADGQEVSVPGGGEARATRDWVMQTATEIARAGGSERELIIEDAATLHRFSIHPDGSRRGLGSVPSMPPLTTTPSADAAPPARPEEPIGSAVDAPIGGHAPSADVVASSPWTVEAEPATEERAVRRPTREDLRASQPAPPVAPAQLGWRGSLNRATGGVVKMSPAAFELRRREDVRWVQASFDAPKTVVVVNAKGGAHKTTTTLMLAATFGQFRGGSTLAWDNNETQGTLGARSWQEPHQTNTAVQLLRDVERFQDAQSGRFGDLSNYVRSQGDGRFDVLASDDRKAADKVMDGADFHTLHAMLERFYRVMVVDTGNNTRAGNWRAAVESADQIVIASTVREDTASVAASVADTLDAMGLGEKVEEGVTILSDASPTVTAADKALAGRLEAHFGQLTRAVVRVPYEREFVGGGVLNLDRLHTATREAWLHATARVAEGLS